jgi:ribonuclease D
MVGKIPRNATVVQSESAGVATGIQRTMRLMSRDRAAALPSGSAEKISREEMSELPIRRYEGPVHVIAGRSDLQHAMQDIFSERAVGFDTETRPAFRPGESYLPSLVQFATASAVYLLRAQQQDLFGAMREILSSEKIIKVGVSVADDLRNLKALFEFEERSVVDLGEVAKRHGLKQTGVRNLAGIFLGARIPKGAKTTNWAARRLTPQQIAYAATDAWACRELYLRFEELKMV